MAKKDATSFQWRKLREASLISLKTQIKEPQIIEFMINGNLFVFRQALNIRSIREIQFVFAAKQ